MALWKYKNHRKKLKMAHYQKSLPDHCYSSPHKSKDIQNSDSIYYCKTPLICNAWNLFLCKYGRWKKVLHNNFLCQLWYKMYKKIVAAFRGLTCCMWNIAMCDYKKGVTTGQTHGQTDRQTDTGQSDLYVPYDLQATQKG